MVYFQTKNPKLGKFLMVNVTSFYDHLEYFMAIWYNLWPFGIVCGHLLFFSQFGMFGPREIWQPCKGYLKKYCYRSGAILIFFLPLSLSAENVS
jgi:hypothetical protein